MNKDNQTEKKPTAEIQEASSALVELSLTDEAVASFLLDNPNFFNRNPNLLTTLQVNDNRRGTISLVERQQQQLRQKAQGLEEEITHLMSVANHNEKLFRQFSDLYLLLLDCQSAQAFLDCLSHSTQEILSLAGLKLWLCEPVNVKHACISVNDCQGVMQNRLAKEDFYFGRLHQNEQELIFSEHSVGSVVLIKLNVVEPINNQFGESALGFLAVSSDDAEHFDPRMDTLLLNQFRRLVAKLLQRHLLSMA